MLALLWLVVLPLIWAAISFGRYMWSPARLAVHNEKPNIVFVRSNHWCGHNPLAGDSRGCLADFRLECTYCGYQGDWESRHHFLSDSPYSGWREALKHTCPSVEDAIKPKTWEIL